MCCIIKSPYKRNLRKEITVMDKVFDWIMDNWAAIVAFVDKFFATLVEAAA